MYKVLLISLLLTSLALGQGVQPQTAQPAASKDAPVPQHHDDDDDPAPASAAKVLPASPVITIHGICDNGAKIWKPADRAKPATPATSPCETVITRAQFEMLSDSLNPQMSALSKRQLADAYPRLLLFADTARELGIDKDPHFQELLSFASLRLLSEMLTRQMQQKAGDISDTEIEKYYNENPTKFERIDLLRIFIPRQKEPIPGKADPAEAATDETAMKMEAEKIHSEAVAGGDFQPLQQEAFEAAHLKSNSPNVSLGKLAIGRLPLNHQNVFDLNPGRVSGLISDPAGYYIYKVISKDMTPLAQAKPEIRNSIQTRQMQSSTDALLKNISTDLNPDYFGAISTRTRPQPPSQPAKPETK
jgi:PPIC-type PPIASE domain